MSYDIYGRSVKAIVGACMHTQTFAHLYITYIIWHIYIGYIIGYISGVRITTPFRSDGPAQYNSGLQAISKLGVQWGSDTLTTTQLALHHLSAKTHCVHLHLFMVSRPIV